MRKLAYSAAVLLAFAAFPLGCASDRSDSGLQAQPNQTKPSASETRPATTQSDIRTDALPGRRGRLATTRADNPTTKAGRGEPSLDDADRPAAWILVDGQSGVFTERDGQKQMQWVIEKPVSASPTFSIEVYEPLLGRPTDLKYIVKTIESADGSEVAYAISAGNGAFTPSTEYKLLNPGEAFVIRNWATGDVVREIAPLPPGTYLIAAKLGNSGAGKEAAAVTYFTVGGGG